VDCTSNRKGALLRESRRAPYLHSSRPAGRCRTTDESEMGNFRMPVRTRASRDAQSPCRRFAALAAQ